MRKLFALGAVILLALSIVGCSSYSADVYERESSGQRVEITFEELDGKVEELIHVDRSGGLDIDVLIDNGEIELELAFLDEEEEEPIVTDQLSQVFDSNNDLQYSTDDSFNNGVYRLLLSGEDADGTVVIDFN
ncbi:hypothetical protein PRVXH_000782 [Proteinivorax hydrogeniformans]|uniref:Lipoprotein n=1 Tax=Proteinivorax hydrogeniformans TaxID=1826727 RepID=A0AAU8HVM0_9FIRM